MKSSKYTYSNLKMFVEYESNSGCKLVTNESEYKNSLTKIDLICKCGQSFKTLAKTFYNGKQCCSACTKQRMSRLKSNYELVENFVSNHGCKLLTTKDEYKNQKEKIKIGCKCNNIFYVSFSVFKRDDYIKSCDDCSYKHFAKKTKTPFEYVKAYIEECGYKITTTKLEYYSTPNKDLKLKLICPKSHEFKMSWSKFNHRKHRCPKCSKNKSYNFEEVKKIIENKIGYKLLSNEYANCKTPLYLECTKGHRFQMCLDYLLNGKCKCPECNISRGELRIKHFLDKNNIIYSQQFSFENCKYKNKLPFDFAIFDNNNNLKCLIEYDGIQHFEPIEYFGGEERLNEQKIKDNIKNRFSKSINVDLIRIPYWDFDEIENILMDLC